MKEFLRSRNVLKKVKLGTICPEELSPYNRLVRHFHNHKKLRCHCVQCIWGFFALLILNFRTHQHHLDSFFNTDCWAPLIVSEFEGLSWSLRICLSNEFPVGADLADWVNHFEIHCFTKSPLQGDSHWFYIQPINLANPLNFLKNWIYWVTFVNTIV